MKAQEANQFSETHITSFQIGPDSEKDIVCVEDLLMKLALAELVIREMEQYIEATEQNDGIRPDHIFAPDSWALAGLSSNITEVAHALKAGCWGHEAAFLH